MSLKPHKPVEISHVEASIQLLDLADTMALYISKYVSKCMPLKLSCKCGHRWTYKGKSEHYATCPRCHNLVNVKKASGKGDTELTPEEIAVLDRADNELPEGAPACDPWAGMWICKQCWGGAFETLKFIHGPVFCPICGAKNTVVRLDGIPDWMERIEKAKKKPPGP
jgi:hypothetical protein